MQFGHRVALMGMLEQHFGQSLVVGALGGSVSARFMRFIALMTMKMQNATITKSRHTLMNMPYRRATPGSRMAFVAGSSFASRSTICSFEKSTPPSQPVVFEPCERLTCVGPCQRVSPLATPCRYV